MQDCRGEWCNGACQVLPCVWRGTASRDSSVVYLWMLQGVLHKLADVMQHCLNASQVSVAHSAGLCIATRTQTLWEWDTSDIADPGF